MPLKQIPQGNPEQLSFKAFELAEVVARLLALEAEKKMANEKFNMQIKECKMVIVELSAEIKEQRGTDNQSRKTDS